MGFPTTNVPLTNASWNSLVVYFSEDSPSITDAAGPRVAINEGATLKLYCLGDGNPQPVITWKLLGTNQTLQEEDERLMILNTQKSHAGVYLCTASNFLGNDSKTIAVDVWCEYVIDKKVGNRIAVNIWYLVSLQASHRSRILNPRI